MSYHNIENKKSSKFSAFAAIGAVALPIALAAKYGIPNVQDIVSNLITLGVTGMIMNPIRKAYLNIEIDGPSEKDRYLEEKYGKTTVIAKTMIEGAALGPVIAVFGPGAAIGGLVNGVKNLAVEEISKLREKFKENSNDKNMKFR
jgi:hypothetical protein